MSTVVSSPYWEGYGWPEPPVAGAARHGLSGFDLALICIFMLGIYTHYTIPISDKVPFPSVPAGLAGLLMLWRRRQSIGGKSFAGLLLVFLIYVVSILVAPDLAFLPRRFNGLIQLTYSILIGYGLFLTVAQGTRSQIARLFLCASLIILTGCLLETYGGLRPISDSVRQVLYPRGLYENDLRDMLMYKRVRPKFFASEPASVTFCYSLFTFIWFVVSRWRLKLALYVALIAAGIFAMPGPTLLLMLLLVLPYMLFLASRRNGKFNSLRFAQVAVIAALFCGSFLVLVAVVFPERFNRAASGDDASFFYRVRGPAIAGIDSLEHAPVGAGLTGEPYVAQHVVDLYVKSPAYSSAWEMVHPSTELLINYFWLHWIYLGPFFGIVVIAAISLWLRVLGVPSPAFCWFVWSILGQASGAYVGPTCWAVLFLTGAAALIHQRNEESERPGPWGDAVPPTPVSDRVPAPRQA
ncbi:MAG: hypothetical protein JSS04_20265 [Proteobacteria bacterium]|nr:hypothetical protein [Pseudomonadota bacterium]